MNAQLLNKLRRDARNHPGKTAVLCLLALVMGGMWLRLLGGGDATPRPAAAGAAVTKVAPKTDKKPVVLAQADLERLQEWTAQPIEPLERNLFAVDLSYYRRESGSDLRDEEEPGFWTQLAKSRARKTDQKRARQILIENLQTQAARIQLQSTMMGATPKAMVNGKLVEVGNVVTVEAGRDRFDFRVIRIEARQMIVEREGILLAIAMK